MSDNDDQMSEDNSYGVGDEELAVEQGDAVEVLAPNEYKGNSLFACPLCFLILSKNQWRDDGQCKNCDFNYDFKDPERKLISKFTGITCITNPANSWQANRMKVVKGIRVNIAGAYAISVTIPNE